MKLYTFSEHMRRRALSRRAWYKEIFYDLLAIFVVSFFRLAGIHWDVRGVENIPKAGAYIVAGNHRGRIDPFVLWLFLPREIYFFAGTKLFPSRAWKWLVSFFGNIRDDRKLHAVRTALRRLAEGKVLVVFPEGERKPEETRSSIHHGVGYLAIRSGVPVIPVFINGTERVLELSPLRIRRGVDVSIIFGKEITVEPADERDRAESARIVSEDIMNRVYELGAIQCVRRTKGI